MIQYNNFPMQQEGSGILGPGFRIKDKRRSTRGRRNRLGANKVGVLQSLLGRYSPEKIAHVQCTYYVIMMMRKGHDHTGTLLSPSLMVVIMVFALMWVVLKNDDYDGK